SVIKAEDLGVRVRIELPVAAFRPGAGIRPGAGKAVCVGAALTEGAGYREGKSGKVCRPWSAVQGGRGECPGADEFAQLSFFFGGAGFIIVTRSEEHTSELQSRENLVC